MIFVVESVNFLVILSSFQISDVVTDFMALAVISEFDDAFYSALGDDLNKEVIDESETAEFMFLVTRTTSKMARMENEEHRLDDETYVGA